MLKRFSWMPIFFLLAGLFLAVCYLVYQQIFSQYFSDIAGHIAYLYMYFYSDDFYIPHPAWHYGVWYTSKLLHISVEYAAVLFSASLVTLWAWLVYRVVSAWLGQLTPLARTLITALILLVGPLCIPWYNHIVFLGQGSPNLWHNVTIWTVKPLALIAMLLMLRAIETRKVEYYVFASLVTLLSIFAKPSFIIVFLPALFVFVLLKKVRQMKFVVFFAVTSALGGAILLYQLQHLAHFQESKVIFDFLGVWSLYSRNIAISILLALAFPLVLFMAAPKVLENSYILLSWLQIIFGIVYYACFAQSGHYYSHGNFGWSYLIAMSLLYLFSIVEFIRIQAWFTPIRRIVLWGLLLIQTAEGAYYFLKVLQGQNPLYISIFL